MNGINRRGILESVLKGTGLTESTKEIDGGECEMLEVLEVGLYAFFEALSVVVCFQYLYGEKLHWEKISIIFLITDVILMEILYLLHLKSIWSLIIFPIIFLYSGFRFGFKLKPLIINNVLQSILLATLQASIMMVYSVIANDHKLKEMDGLIVNGLMLLIVLCGLKRCKLKKISDILQSNEKIVIISLSVVAITIVSSFLNFKQNTKIEMLYYVVLGITILLIIITAIDIGRNKIKVKEKEMELHLHKLYEASFRELIDEICARQHEFDNHINTIYSQHRLYKTYDALVEAQKKYCGEIMEENRYNKILSKGNPIILCFLYSQFSEMEKKGISVTYQINIADLECGMPVHKMVELVGNLIKNAVEAVQKSGKEKVHVMMLEEKTRVLIEVANESEMIDEKIIKEFYKKGYSDKGKNRGYGLYNVGKICEEYGAAIDCKNENKNGYNCLVFYVVINKPL